MPLCQAFKADHHPCTRNASRSDGDTHPEHLHLCGQHKTTYHRNFFSQAHNTHHTAGRCFHLSRVIIGRERTWAWCQFGAEDGHMLCNLHERIRLEHIQREQDRVNDRGVVRGLVDQLLAEDPPVPWRRAARVLAEMDGVRLDLRHQAAFDYYQTPRTRQLEDEVPGWFFRIYWEWAVNGQVGPEPVREIRVPIAPAQAGRGWAAAQIAAIAPRPAGLAALARDNQNVHTRVVTEQTNKATEKLLAVKVPETQQTEKTLALVWIGGVGGKISYGQFLRVATDVNKWFNTKDCRIDNDNLYRKLLRGLVALIGSEKDEERRSEMHRRCWEECNEAVGMCCEGHISRLCNVLVGFDDDFQPPVPFGEILQSKMAAISAMDLSDEEKRKLANAFFDEHKTPVEERTAWLDAF